MANKTPQETLDALFPLPLDYRADPSPASNPGSSHASAKTLVKLLKDNHERWHIFFNDQGFHNHASHHLFALYALGARPPLIEAAYESQIAEGHVKDAFDSPGEITEQNWRCHLGDERYYRAYISFFTSSVLTSGIPSTLEKFILTPESNFIPGKSDKEQPQMLNRFLSGLLHPIIHAGHGVEFNVPGMIVEGLGMTTATGANSGALIPRELFYPPSSSLLSSSLSTLTSTLSLTSKPTTPHALTILSQVLSDSTLQTSTFYNRAADRSGRPFAATVEARGEYIWKKYASTWEVDGNDLQDVEKKLEELAWVVSVLYGVGGLQKGKEFQADFFLMHCVTSSLFLPSYMSYLTPSSRSILLRSYFAIILAYWISRGRPSLNIANFYERTKPHLTPPGPHPPLPNPATLGLDKDKEFNVGLTPNPWFPLLQSGMTHPEEHLVKIQRTLAHYAAKYGAREAGYFSNSNDGRDGGKGELEGVEKLDGTLFLRVAGLTAGKLGWIREGEEKGGFENGGFYEAGDEE